MDKPTGFRTETLIPLVLAEEAWKLQQASKSRQGRTRRGLEDESKRLEQEWANSVSALLAGPNAPRA